MRRALLAGVLVFAMHAAAASAANVVVGCAKLPEELSKALPGETITLDELCKTGVTYHLPNVEVTLTGTPGAGFDTGGEQLVYGGASATIENLIFENAKNAGSLGGALDLADATRANDFTLVGDTFEHDEVEGTERGGGGAIIETDGTATVTESTFLDDTASGEDSDGGGLYVFAVGASITADTFTGDAATDNGFGGGLYAVFDAPGGLVAGSRFSDDRATDIGGGAVVYSQATKGAAATLSANTFSDDAVADPTQTGDDLQGYGGGGLALLGSAPIAFTQSGNTFDSNSVSFKPAAVLATGGGESVIGAELESTGDHFTDNSLQSPDASMNPKLERVWGWGAGLSVIACGDTESVMPKGPNLLSTVTDGIVAGNTLISGPSANGAGIYVGAVACASSYADLQLNDSTVSGNVVAGVPEAVAGVSGGPHDVLSLANTILDGDSGGPELGGFAGLANVTASYSDLCAGAAPFAGTGNICAEAKLVGAGPGSADVHETAASPTRDAGSNALVPTGLSTDAYGGPRILEPEGCGHQAVVDIGAAEYPGVSSVPPCSPLPLTVVLPVPQLSGVSQSAKTWREGTKLAQLSSSKHRKPPVGTTFRFKLSEPAAVTLTFTTSARGRRVGRRCLAQNARNRHKRRCTRTIIAGAMTLAGHAGVNKLRFYGRLSAHKRLAPGTYTVTLVAVAGGRRSAPQKLQFTIVR